MPFILQVYSLLEKATQNRAVAATQCNERSSRSHSVFRLKLTGENHLTGEKCQGTEFTELKCTREPFIQICFPALHCKNFFLSRPGVVFPSLAFALKFDAFRPQATESFPGLWPDQSVRSCTQVQAKRSFYDNSTNSRALIG